MKKIICLALTILMLLTSVACGTDVPADTTAPQELETEPPIKETDYSQKKFPTYNADGSYFFSTTEIPAFIDNNAGLRLSALNSKFAFTADCEGNVVLGLETKAISDTADIASLTVSVDGGEAKKISLIYLKQNLVIAEGLEKGVHTFVIEKLSGGDIIRIDSVTINGETREAPALSVENGVFVEVFDFPGGEDEYSSFNVYTQTTHPSGEYFIRYKFAYEYDAINSSLTWDTGSNTGANRSNYRIRTAQIVKKTGEKSFTDIYEILQSGEISLAIKEYSLENGKNAGDFVGGFHGDENLKTVSLVLDGNKKIALFEGKEGFYNCTTVEFVQNSVINRCHTWDDYVMNHNQSYLIDTNGVKLLQQVEWLTDNYGTTKDQTYIQMFTLNRINAGNKNDFLTTRLNLLNEDGSVIAKADLTAIDPGDKEGVTAVSSSDARYAEYFGEDKGIYAKVGFQFIDKGCKLNAARISVRKYGDSKWYPSFGDPKGNPKKGDTWTINSIYYIDYNPTN